MLLERLAKGCVAVIARGQRHFCDVYRAHPQLAPGALQTDAADLTDGALTDMRREDTMEVRYRESRHLRQRFTIERLTDVLADVAHHILNAVSIVLKDLCIVQHICTIVYQNTCSLFQMYHLVSI